MSIYTRENEYIQILSKRDYSVKELAKALFISEPTVRRDIIAMKDKELISCQRGMVSLNANSPDKRIPMFIRNIENPEAKIKIARKAASHIKNGDIIMLDASTTAYALLPELSKFKNLFVITAGAKTAIDLAAMGIKTLCIGGEIALESFSYIGADAERTLRLYNADIAFFSCRGLTEDGIVTDNSIMENSIRRIMIRNSKKSILLCDKSKIGKVYLSTLCNQNEIREIITD